jgi:cytochrome c
MGMIKVLLGLSVLLLGITFPLVESNTVLGAEDAKHFLADKHGKSGIACNGCHKEKPPKSAVSTAACIRCHKEIYKKSEEGKKGDPNPHQSHQGEVPCESCHHGHKASENMCGSCHDFDFKVP